MKNPEEQLPGKGSATHEDLRAKQLFFLVGFMGAGKSSVGLALGRRLSWPFVDLDERIEARMGVSVPEIFRDSGEAEFRKIERITLRELLSEQSAAPRIVALGGGAFAYAENAELIERAQSVTIFLDASAEELFRRCEMQEVDRPLRQSLDDFRNLYLARRPRYLTATLRIETDGKDVETIAAEVAGCLGLGKHESQ